MILLIDNYDSFSYNLFQMVGAIEPDIRVIRNDACSIDEIRQMNPSGIIISPGPGRPEDAGICIEAVRSLGEEHSEETDTGNSTESKAAEAGNSAASKAAEVGNSTVSQTPEAGTSKKSRKQRAIPILGVCLGHQSICAAYGATVGYAKELMHGKTSECRIDTSSALFIGLNEIEPVGRYHSLAAIEETMPDCLKVTARTQDGEIMAVEHKRYPIYGIQFHPESILTPHGAKILKNFVDLSQI